MDGEGESPCLHVSQKETPAFWVQFRAIGAIWRDPKNKIQSPPLRGLSLPRTVPDVDAGTER